MRRPLDCLLRMLENEHLLRARIIDSTRTYFWVSVFQGGTDVVSCKFGNHPVKLFPGSIHMMVLLSCPIGAKRQDILSHETI